MTLRRKYEMSPESLSMLLDAMKPVPYIIIGGIGPRSLQDRMNTAWQALGNRMGFDHMTAQPLLDTNNPNCANPRFFTAVPLVNFVERTYEEFPNVTPKANNSVSPSEPGDTGTLSAKVGTRIIL